MAFVPEDTQTQQPATVSRTATLFVFPVTIKASRPIEAFTCDCSLIALLLCCGKAAIPTEKVNVRAVPLQGWQALKLPGV